MATKNTKPHKIGWLNVPGYIPQTWNPIVGCSKVSEGCRNCYAERMAHRLAAMKNCGYENVIAHANGRSVGQWNGETNILNAVLQKPLGWKKPRAIFVNSMGDLFHENTPDEWIDRVFAVMALCPQHLFIVLTKRAERMERYTTKDGVAFRWAKQKLEMLQQSDAVYRPMPEWMKPLDPKTPIMPNVWMGVTVEDQEQADERIPHLLRCPASQRFVSCEPLIGPVDIQSACMIDYQHSLLPGNDSRPMIKWVICGGESGPGARPMNPEWARSLRDQAMAAGVPFFFKQWGDKTGAGRPLTHSAGREFSEKRGGDVLDGRQWHQWPTSGKSDV